MVSNPRHRFDGCIPTALVTVGSNVSSLSRLLTRLNGRLTASGEGGVIVLESGDAPNLKTTLKNIIRAAITNIEGNEGYQKFLTDRAVSLPIDFSKIAAKLCANSLAGPETISVRPGLTQ